MDCMRDGFRTSFTLDGGRFETVSPLNHGSFGMVLAAKDNLTGQDVAIKCLTKPGATATDYNCPAAIAIDDRSEELAIHSRLTGHANIVNLIHHFETDNHQYMVLELCNNGDLYEAIRQGKGPLETGHVRDFMLELVSAIDYLHSNGVYHRDIKPENIFLTSNGAMKLGDFGLATTETWSTEFAVGSDRYMAPEQFDASVYGYGYSPAAADIWAIGIVLLNVLFQRNPFATPTQKDPLFADFASDRQSLFDVFPNMSQDTYNVLVHSLALDPANRSLAAVRDALKDVVSFTVDDETLDDFCTEQNDLVPVVTAAREPLRTPSITSPNLSTNDAFPWSTAITQALLKSPQKAGRQLSTIRDEEMDLFPEPAQSDWQYMDTDEASLASNLDSGLGMSYKSSKSNQSVNPPPKKKATFVGSLPISFSRPFGKTSPYGASGFSKSWSDLWDEEEEMQETPLAENVGMDIERAGTAKPGTPRINSLRGDSCGSITPRQGMPDLDANARIATPSKGTPTEEKSVELPKTLSSTILDKWAALGNFRRAKLDVSPAGTPTPPKTKYSEAFASFTSFGSGRKQKAQATVATTTRDRAPSWRQGSPQRLRALSSNNSKVWQEDNNWREHKPPVRKNSSPSLAQQPGSRRSPSGPKQYNHEKYLPGFDSEEIEWVGGWRDFHL